MANCTSDGSLVAAPRVHWRGSSSRTSASTHPRRRWTTCDCPSDDRARTSVRATEGPASAGSSRPVSRPGAKPAALGSC